VFSVAYTRTRQLLATGKIALFDATNSGPKPVKSLIIETRPTETLLILMRDAEDLDLCVKRVERDVDKGVDRSAVPREIIEKQYVRFINFVTNVESLKDFGVSVLWSDDIDRIREVINDN
jgi:predicted kinase